MSKKDGGEKGKGGSSQTGQPFPVGVRVSGQNIVITGNGGSTVVTTTGEQTTTFDDSSSDSSSSGWSDSGDDGLVVHTVTGPTIVGARGNIQAANIATVHMGHFGPSHTHRQPGPKQPGQKEPGQKDPGKKEPGKKEPGKKEPQKDCFPKDFKAWLLDHEVTEETVAALVKEGFDTFKIFACIEDSDITDLGVNKGQQRLLKHLAGEAQKMKKGGGRGPKRVDYDSGVTDFSDGNITVKNSRMILTNVQGGDVAMVRVTGAGAEPQIRTSHFHAPVVAGVVGDVKGKIGNIVVSSTVTRGDWIKGKSSSKVWQGALSDDTLSHLSQNLGDEWMQVIINLGVTHPTVQQVQSEYRNLSQCIMTLLHRWRNSCEDSEDSMVNRLLNSLGASDRNDLRGEVEKRHYHSQESLASSGESPSCSGQSTPYQSAQHGIPQDCSQPVPPSQHDPAPDLSLHPNLRHSTTLAMPERELMDVDGN